MLLLLIYRSPVLQFVPLVAVGFGYFVAGGILALAANALDVTLSGQATSLMVILLFGAGTDYGLLLISRYREDLRRESDARAALTTALGETWEAIAGQRSHRERWRCSRCSSPSTATTARSRRCLAVGVFVTLIAGLTLMPALLALLGRRAFWPRRPKEGDETRHRTWERVANWVAAGPRRAALLVTAVLVVLAMGCLFYSPRFASPRTSSRACPRARATRVLERHSPRERWRRRPCSSRRPRRRPSRSPA